MSYALKALFFASILISSVSIMPFTFAQNATALPSPLKQITSGILPENVVCIDNFVLIKKKFENSVACVKPVSVHKVISRGWILESKSVVTLTEGQSIFQLLVQKIFNDNATVSQSEGGPAGMPTRIPMTLHFGDSINLCKKETLTLILIENKTATFLASDHNAPCPATLA